VIRSGILLTSTTKFTINRARHVNFEALREIFDIRLISRRLWPLFSYNLTPCVFYWCGSLKDKLCKIPHGMKNYRTVSFTRCQKLPWLNSGELTRFSAGMPSIFVQEGSIFITCCSSGKYLLAFLKFIITGILCVPPFTGFYLSRHASWKAMLA
jgi:hypothetical protein